MSFQLYFSRWVPILAMCPFWEGRCVLEVHSRRRKSRGKTPQHEKCPSKSTKEQLRWESIKRNIQDVSLNLHLRRFLRISLARAQKVFTLISLHLNLNFRGYLMCDYGSRKKIGIKWWAPWSYVRPKWPSYHRHVLCKFMWSIAYGSDLWWIFRVGSWRNCCW